MTDQASEAVEKRCSCAEIAGEDPRCFRHGEGTMWAKENPDLCALYERYTDLRAALAPFAAAADDLDDAHSDNNGIWEAPAAMSITAGDLRHAASLLDALTEQEDANDGN